MNLYHLNQLIQDLPQFKRVINSVISDTQKKVRANVRISDQAINIYAASMYTATQRPLLLLSAHPESAKRKFEQIKLWLKSNENLFYFPEKDLLPSTVSFDPMLTSERLRIYSLLTDYFSSPNEGRIPPFIVASALSLANRSPNYRSFIKDCLEIRTNMNITQLALLEKVQNTGYEYDKVVEIPGTFAKRGGIVDIFPVGQELPVRIEFLGNTIESIREYNPRTQLSSGQVTSLRIPPAAEYQGTGTENILDYISKEAIVALDDPDQIEAEIERIERQSSDLAVKRSLDENEVEKGNTSLNWQQIETKLSICNHVVEFHHWQKETEPSKDEKQDYIESAPNFTARIPFLIEQLAVLREKGTRTLIVSLQADRVTEMLREHSIEVSPILSLEHLPPPGSLTLVKGSIEGGWNIKGNLLLLTDLELFGIVKQRRTAKSRPVRHHLFLNDINTGDFVVHIEHGIGHFAGVVKKVSAGVVREYLVLEYAGGDTLYVPIEQLDRVSLYIGGGERVPSLSRLGSQEWNRARQRVKASVDNIAGELIELYANRAAGNGQAFSPDTLWQQELEASFPYVETIDQLEAVKAVKSDMESTKVMDRLVCGDVGYGKTEIAVRAAFKAVMDGKQVAILVPTTILAQQHANTFKERLKTFPVKIEVLSRFCSHNEQVEVIDKLAKGAVDICIGTHRLLQKDVIFHDLGLAVIDEEQRFGVIHKEHFKKMRQAVDVLTLSATPIPRTMHMALAGIRDLSMIETPPESRLPIITFVGEFSNKLIREAILREMERDGQVFIVHNRVHSISELAYKIANLVPEARLSVAHGQMNEDKIEQVMNDFVKGESDVLISTTIIESGLDMPNVNTLIVDDADKLGLTQLYQLRGRVGRGANVAYAFFTFDSGKKLTDHARERLKTIAEATELGAGFAIAIKDLEIRGAGNLLGVEQSGNIAAVGFNYYCQLLADAVEQLRAKIDGREIPRKEIEQGVSIDLKIPAYIPEDYIEDTRTRFNVYQRLTKCSSAEEVNRINTELLDRFGEIPAEVINLLYIVELKSLAKNAGIESIFLNDETITISFLNEDLTGNRFINLTKSKNVRTGNRQMRIEINSNNDTWKEQLKHVVNNLSENQIIG